MIVGAGPVGLVAALAARHHGVRAVVLEARAHDEIRPGSRAVYLFRESLDLLETIAPGVTGPLIEQSRGWNALRTTYAGKEVFHHRFPAAAPGRFGVSLSQRDQEAVLLERCVAEGVEIRWDTELESLRTEDDGVVLEPHGGAPLRARYVVGADGARSTVRGALGIELSGDRSESTYVIADVRDDPAHPLPLTKSFHYRHPGVDGRNVFMVPFGGGWRLDFQCRPGEDATPWTTEPRLSEWISAVAGPGYAASQLWVSSYQFNQAVATGFTDAHARVLLAGEAAHLFAPFGGGRGLNSGIPDAVFAVEAIAGALAAATPADAARQIVAVADERRSAALVNRAAAAQSLAHMEARTLRRRLAQWLAARLAPRSTRAGRWLDRAPMGPPTIASSRSRF